MTAMVAAATLAGCSGGHDKTTGPAKSIEIALSAATLSVVQGASNTVTATIMRIGGFADAAAITVEGAPTGVTATPAPASIPNTSTTSVITIAAAATTTPGTYNLTVKAAGTGVTTKSTPLTLTVTAAPAQSYSIALTPTTLSIPQSGNGSVNIALTRTGGFGGTVTLTAEGLPTGVTGAFSPVSLTANASVLTLTAAANAIAGTSTITVRGTATGQTDKTATFQLTITAVTAGSYTLAVTPAAVTVQQGANATANVALTRTGGFAGAVAFTAEGLPAGVTGAFNPNNTTTDASVLTLTAAASATAGASTITVRGTATGQADKTATFQLTVNAAPAGGFTLSVAPTTVPVQQGGNGTTTVTINRTNNFAGTVNLTATGLPNGVTATFNPAAATANTSTLTLAAAATAALGQATVTIHGNATGIAEQTVAVTANVTAPTGGSGNTTWEFCTAADTPLWLAVQDGAGTWTRVTPTGTTFKFNIGTRGGVAYVLPSGSATISSASRTLARRMSASLETALLMRNKAAEVRASRYASRSSSLVNGFELNIVYGTQGELNTEGTSQCVPGSSGKTVNGTVANVSATQSASISLGDAFTSLANGATTFTLTDVPDGTVDLVASRSMTTISGTTFTTVVDKLIIRRGLNPANNSTLPVLDFNAAEAFAPAEANITVGNLGSDASLVTTAYFTSGASGASLFSGFQTGAGPFKYYGVPTAKQSAGDLHFAFVIGAPVGGSGDNTRFTGLFFKDPTDRTVTLGAALPTPAVTAAATTPYVRFRATGTLPAEYGKFLTLSFEQASVGRTVSIEASAGYLNNATAYDLSIPDFSAVAGWDNNWGPKVAAATDWTVSGIGFTGIGLSSPNPVEGSTIQGATHSGTITP